MFKWCLPQAKRNLLQCISENNLVSLPRDNDEMPARLLSTDDSSTTSSNCSSSSEIDETNHSECSDDSDDDQEREMDQFIQCNDLDSHKLMIPSKKEFRRFTT